MTEAELRKTAAARVADAMDPAFFEACCHPVRMALLRNLIASGAMDIASLAAPFDQHRSVISRHLMLMERAGLLVSRKVGREVTYDIDGPNVVEKLERLATAARALTQICCPASKVDTDD